MCAVIVVVAEESGTDVSTYDQAKPYTEGSSFYITAAWDEVAISAGRVPAEIVIGDDQVYVVLLGNAAVGYRNVPLQSGTQYSFFTRYDIRNELNEHQVSESNCPINVSVIILSNGSHSECTLMY